MKGPLPPAAPCGTRYALSLETGGGFEVEAFDVDGGYALRRHVRTIEEAAWLLRVPLVQAQASLLGLVA